MLSLLKIKNVALIDELSVEFAAGLNLLTGETGSGKSIIVDSLGALTGERVSSNLIKEGEDSARIEGLFLLSANADLHELFYQSGIELEDASEIDLIVRRDISNTGRNRIFVNNQLVTQSFLKKIGVILGEIHGQGEQALLFNPSNHLEILDKYARVEKLRESVGKKFREMNNVRKELEDLQEDESQKLQLLDILNFQIDEISKANLEPGEDEILEEEKKRLNNVEKLSTLSDEAYALLYENEDAIVSNLEKVMRRINELSEYDSRFAEYEEGLDSAQAVLEDLAFAVRDFGGAVEFSPERLEEIENRLAEISRLKRKYGGSLTAVLQNLEESNERIDRIQTSELKEKELLKKLAGLRGEYIKIASDLHETRKKAAKKFEKEIEKNLRAVALEKSRFVVNFKTPEENTFSRTESDRLFTSKGFDQVEFYFSANPGQSPKQLAKVASGGEASRLMLILKTVAGINYPEKSVVFDEVDAGIGGRVAEAVGLKLKELSRTQQVLCVTHQPQVASLADQHFIVEKRSKGKKTEVGVRELNEKEQIEEIARMLAGEKITDAARQNAREMLKNRVD
jgi:DNA repair protein RecN (Recombination protein N)